VERSLYEEHATLEQDHWWFVARRAIVASVLARHLPPVDSRRVLDVGCGTGGMLPMLARFGDVSGLESETIAVEHCHRAHAEIEVRQGDIPVDVPSDASLDVVTAFDVIEHIEDDLGALGALREALRPGGAAVVTVPALTWLWSDHDVVNGHHRRYERRGLTEVIDRAGLSLVHVSSFNTVLLPGIALARLGQRLRPRPVTPDSDFTMPSARVNAVLTRAMGAERSVVARRGLPIGVSLVAVARRPR